MNDSVDRQGWFLSTLVALPFSSLTREMSLFCTDNNSQTIKYRQSGLIFLSKLVAQPRQISLYTSYCVAYVSLDSFIIPWPKSCRWRRSEGTMAKQKINFSSEPFVFFRFLCKLWEAVSQREFLLPLVQDRKLLHYRYNKNGMKFVVVSEMTN